MRRLLLALIIALPLVTFASPASAADGPPPAGGYFTLTPAGQFDALPTDAECAALVHQSTWEPRPENAQENARVFNADRIHRSFAARPTQWSSGWDNKVLPRVDGHYSGTTDEIIQWGACKWGLPDDVLRGVAVRESTWYSYLHYTSGEPYPNRGSGDIMPAGQQGAGVYCDGLTTKGGVDYQQWYGDNICPKTFGLTGTMSWENPSWGKMKGNQNGTFPFNRDSTAFAVDYMAAHVRGCMEGYIPWLTPPTNDVWGCVGSWYAGNWHSADADGYASRVQAEISNRTWAQPSFVSGQYQCDPVRGCPV